MTFEKIDINSQKTTNERSCIIICNFNERELKLAKSCCQMIAIKDVIRVSEKNADTKISDIVGNNISHECTDSIKDKVIIFNNIPNNKISFIMDSLKKVKVNNVLFAVVTETSKQWKLKELISNLVQEKIALENGTELEH